MIGSGEGGRPFQPPANVVIDVWRSRRNSSDWRRSLSGSHLSRRDLWSGEGDYFRSWFRSKKRDNVVFHLAIWVIIFASLIVVYSFSGDLIAVSRRLMQRY